MKKLVYTLLAAGATISCAPLNSSQQTTAGFCPQLYRSGVMSLPFNPAFLHVQAFDAPGGGKRDDLLMSSFFNAVKDAAGKKVVGFTQRDLVARIIDLDGTDPARFDADERLEILSDLDGVERQVWPNETSRVPDGVLPFEAVISPQGFLATPRPGRLTLLNLDDPERREYIVDQSTFIPPRCKPGSADNQPWFYHDARFIDMDDDGLRDIVTVRSGFLPRGGFCPPSGELLWFKNPGDDLDADTEWEEHVVVGTRPRPGGPEVNMSAHDFDGDGIPEIVASHFFKHDAITVYGAPKGGRWADVDPVNGPFARQNDIMRNQGRPFAVEIVDLNMDGRVDVLTSNHQGDGCFKVTNDKIPGRVIAVEQPADGDIFGGEWQVHVLKDNIRANPTFPEPTEAPGRLAPNRAVPFWPERRLEGNIRPWIVVGGDEASKVWILRPQFPDTTDRWEYASAVVLDINDYYGAGTTQSLLDDPAGISVSTIGGLAWRYDRPGPDGMAEFYFPVFEARDIHVLRFRPVAGARAVSCPADVAVSCPE